MFHARPAHFSEQCCRMKQNNANARDQTTSGSLSDGSLTDPSSIDRVSGIGWRADPRPNLPSFV